MFTDQTKHKLTRLNYLFFLTLVALICAALWGNSQLISAAPTANTIAVTTTDDGLNEDGKCALREALHNANTNSKFSDSPGECVSGSASETDVIVLTSGEEYILNIAGAGDDAGDLDVLDNGLPLDLRLETDEATAVTIRANNGLGDRVLEIHGASVEIENMTVRNGLTGENGGGILNDGGTLSLTNVSLQNNIANVGGGLYNLNGTAVISNSQLIFNTGAVGGGGVANSGLSATLTLQGGTMVRVNQSTSGSGGGVTNSEGLVQVLDNTAVNLNTAAVAGGGIFNNNGGQLTITASSVEGNTATDAEGGGIYVEGEGSSLTMTESSVVGNKALQNATGYGGGVMVTDAATAVVNTSDIRENEAYVGGGLFNDVATLTLTDSTVFTNTATNAGGGLVNREGDVTTTAVTMQGNEAVSPGGGIYNLEGTMTIHNSTLRGNTTKSMGAGLVNNSGTVSLTTSLLQ
ncbi:MAG: hypothetical protein KDD89_05175, partial [Anaerolineales bacterium]|nr:hypothetical protein [Anaerolineales bacterium]